MILKKEISGPKRMTHGQALSFITGSCLGLFICIASSAYAQQNVKVSSALKQPTVKTAASTPNYREGFFQLIQQKDFFKAKAFYSQHRHKLSERDDLFSKAFLAGGLHQPRLALNCISELLDSSADLPDSLQLMLLDLQQNCAASLGDYVLAKNSANKILEHYMDRLSPRVLKLQHNNYELWSALTKQPAQTIDISRDVHLSMHRDAMGMARIRFKGPAGNTLDFNFDPAASISTANQSTAEKLHMRFLSGKLSVASALGHLVPAKIAICDHLSIDGIELKNVVFLVLPDKDLIVPKEDYHITAMLGLPVLQALHEIQLIGGHTFVVPKNTSVKRRGLPLMMKEGQMIVNLNGDPYELHPGTNKSLMFLPYFDAHQSMVKLQGRPTPMTVGGPAASRGVDGYRCDINMRVDDKTITLENTGVLTTATGGAGHLYGRLGRDFIASFDTLTINFDKMFVDLK